MHHFVYTLLIIISMTAVDVIGLFYAGKLKERQPSLCLSTNFQLELPDPRCHSLLAHHIHHYAKTQQEVQAFYTKETKRFLPYIMKEISTRNLPGELAVLPMIESAYRPYALSNKGAYGLWQLQMNTGKRYGLLPEKRADFVASTRVALDYLEFLYSEFYGDWFLALAAYNAGEGRVKQAIAQNRKQGKAINFWALNLPKETKHFVPKILALAHLVQQKEAQTESVAAFALIH
jgi:membrane-bound lytic murein transglycosylase D